MRFANRSPITASARLAKEVAVIGRDARRLLTVGLFVCLLPLPVSAQSIQTFAGGGTDDGRSALLASLETPSGVAIDAASNVYIADYRNHRIRKVSATTGIITTFAGNGTKGFTGDGGPAAEAALNEPVAIALDAAGNLYIADESNNRIRKVDARTSIITTVAGRSGASFGGDGGPATAAGLEFPSSIAVGPSGDLYVVDLGNSRVRKVSAATGIITTVAGNGTWGYSGDGGPATSASVKISGQDGTTITLGSPPSVAVDAAGNLYLSDTYSNRIRKVDANGIITTIAGNGTAGIGGDGGPATAAALNQPGGLTLDASGGLLIADESNHLIRRVALASGIMTTFAGAGAGFSGDGGPASAARFLGPYGIGVGPSGDAFVADTFNNRVRRIAAGTSIITTIAGSGTRFSGDGGAATSAVLFRPASMVFDSSGSMIISEYYGSRIRKVTPDGRISTIAGMGQNGYSGDGGLAIAARMGYPCGVAIDSAGNIFFADAANDRIRRIAGGSGVITTVVGTGTRGFSGDGGLALIATINISSDRPNASVSVAFPPGIVISPTGDLYFSDTFNHRVRKVSATTQIISTIAGTGTAGFSGDGGQATAAQLNLPTGLALDRNLLYVADHDNDRVRQIDLNSGTISTIAGGGSSFGDSGPATAARLNAPSGLAVAASGAIYIADKYNLQIRKVSSGIISTVAGIGTFGSGFFGDNGPAVLAGLSHPYGVTVDSKNNLFIADSEANRVRVLFACVTVTAPALGAPANGATGVSTAPTLAWNKVDGAFRYDVYLSTANPPTLIASDVTATSFAPANLVSGATYYWRVVAKGDPFCVPPSVSTTEVRSFSTSAGCGAPGSFDLSQPGNGATGVAGSTQLSWQAAPGAAIYDVYFGTSNPPPLFAKGASTPAQSVSGLAAQTTYFWFVVAHAACDATKTTTSPTRSFTTSGGCVPAGGFNLVAPANGASSVPVTTTLQWSSSASASGYDVYLGSSTSPPLYLSDVTQTRLGVAGLASSTTYSWRVVAKVACDPSKNVSTSTFTFTTAGGCLAPRTPSITFVPPGNVGVGQTYTIAWSELSDLAADGYFVIERSTSPSFASILDSQQTFSASASFVSSIAGTYYHRVSAVPGCDPSRRSPPSETKSVNVVTGTANVIFTVQPEAVITALGDRLEDKKARFTLENLGATSLQLIIGKGEINSVPFFTIADPSGGDSVFVTLEPRKPKSFEIHYAGPANGVAGAYQGIVFVAATGQGLTITPYAFVNLKIGGGTTSRPQFLSGGNPTEYAFFPGFAGDDANRPPISIELRNDGTAPMELGAEIGPEVWLVPESGWNSLPIPPGASRSVHLSTQRNRAPNGSALPRYTYFTVRSRNGETARLLVQDNDALPTSSGRRSLLDPGNKSFIVPGVVSQAAGFTRLRLTNFGSDPVQTDLFFTPVGADGLNPASVRWATIVIPPNDVVTLTDPLVQVFGLSRPSQGQIEVRAAPEKIGFLIVSSAVFTPSSSGGGYSYEIPTLFLGEGARLHSAHAVIGIASNSSTRTSLTLVETSGTEVTRVHATLFDAQGLAKGNRDLDIPRYGETIVDNIVPALGGSEPFDGGRIELDVLSGGGAVAGVVTMLDATRNNGAAVVSQPVNGAGTASTVVRRAKAGLAGVSVTAVAPVVVNGLSASGANQRTTMGFAITPGGSPVTAVVTYRPSDPAASSISRNIQLSPGVVLSFDNVLEDLFGTPKGQAARGAVFFQTAAGAQVYARLMSQTGSTWSIGGGLPILATFSDVLTSVASKRPLYLDGLEQSVDSTRGTRWNVLINETAGSSGSIVVRLYEAGNRTVPIAETHFNIAAYEQLRLETVFSALGLDTDNRRKDRTNVLCMVVADGGSALISAVGAATDNRTGDTRHITFSPTGGVPSTGVLRLNLVAPVLSAPSPPPSSGGRRRAVHP